MAFVFSSLKTLKLKRKLKSEIVKYKKKKTCPHSKIYSRILYEVSHILPFTDDFLE